MKKIQFALSMMALTVALCFASQPALAQSASDSARNPTAQQQPVQPNDQPAAVSTASEKMFEGTIVKAGDKFVLTATDSKTTYQLDDQQKAQGFVNKSVKVTGVLDASTGTIRVKAIDPA
ncbi:MAG TPA: DUF5818 domain-containing protein [Terriglobales bacterium]|nr:DUF5818 domain-containing protein [Terriglobales bacterium]